MGSNNNIKKYTGIDIEKYHKGLLSPKEMNEMEKAALDDPFLSDAMEGYATNEVNVTADIAELKERLQRKTEEAKIIPLNRKSQKPLPWLRIAAILILVSGAGLLTYKFAFTKKETSLARSEVPRIETIGPTDSADRNETANNEKKENNLLVAPTTSTAQENKQPAEKQKVNDEKVVVLQQPEDEKAGNAADASVPGGVKGEELAKPVTISKQMVKEPAPVLNDEARINDSKKLKQAAAENQKKDILVAGKSEDQHIINKPVMTFHGRVTDSHNIGVPFANVINPLDNTGTYTDANGYFNLTYPDSVLKVEVRSIGYENNLVQLKNRETTNHIILADDSKSLAEIVIGNKLPNTAMRSRDANNILEQPEPADGWAKYDLYLANNLNPPPDYKPKPADYPSVEVSFEVNNNGEPVHIKIEKSLCNKCDKEAIRLIKEGPKWKQNATKNGRTNVIINF